MCEITRCKQNTQLWIENAGVTSKACDDRNVCILTTAGGRQVLFLISLAAERILSLQFPTISSSPVFCAVSMMSWGGRGPALIGGGSGTADLKATSHTRALSPLEEWPPRGIVECPLQPDRYPLKESQGGHKPLLMT